MATTPSLKIVDGKLPGTPNSDDDAIRIAASYGMFNGTDEERMAAIAERAFGYSGLRPNLACL
ncbi:hypothetical protein BC828DRAFT_409487, partial [Blastocladiella britannica]